MEVPASGAHRQRVPGQEATSMFEISEVAQHERAVTRIRVAPVGATEPTVSIHYARALGRLAENRGVRRVIWREWAAAAPGHRVSGEVFLRELRTLAHELGDPGIGLALGASAGGEGFGLLSLLLATAPTLRMAIEHLRHFESLATTLGRLQASQEGAFIDLLWHPRTHGDPLIVEAVLAGWVTFGRFLIERGADVESVSFTHRPAMPVEAYERLLGCPVRFGAAENSVRIAADLLDAPIRFADDRMHRQFQEWVPFSMPVLAERSSGSLVTRVASEVVTHLGEATPDEDWIARRLGVSRRSLQRHLAAEQASFRQLLDAQRAHHAISRLVGDRTSLLQLGADVGYLEQSSLCRAFRRWTGYAPLVLWNRVAGLYGLANGKRS
jgi:AraC-like DNA-binding protein